MVDLLVCTKSRFRGLQLQFVGLPGFSACTTIMDTNCSVSLFDTYERQVCSLASSFAIVA